MNTTYRRDYPKDTAGLPTTHRTGELERQANTTRTLQRTDQHEDRRVRNNDLGFIKQTAYIEPVTALPVRVNPTNQSTIFSKYNYDQLTGTRSRTPVEPRVKASFRQSSPFERTLQQTRHSGRADVYEPIPAGKHTFKDGQIINVAKLDQVEEVIKVEKPSAPVLHGNTTYSNKYQKPGFPVYNPNQKPLEPTIKIEAHEGVYPANKRFPYGVSKETLHDKSNTVATVRVPENVEPDLLKRELANKGYQVVKSYFHHDTITNERTGKGFVQVRAPNPRYHEEIQKEIKDVSIRVANKKNVIPNQNIILNNR